MGRTKWVRLKVRDPGEIIRWASRQNARRLDDFRHRVINGQESVSFRLFPAYPIRIGTRDIVVVCHLRRGLWAELLARCRGLFRSIAALARRARHRGASDPIARSRPRPLTGRRC